MSDSFDTLRRRSGDSEESTQPSAPPKKFTKHSVATWLPWLLLVGFLALIWLLFGDRFEGAREVELAKVVTVRASVEANAQVDEPPAAEALSFDGATLFQASGWIEPDPLLIRATTLYDGVIESVHVLEGDSVVQGQLLAIMIAEDAELDLQTAEASLAQAEATLKQREAELAASGAALATQEQEVSAAQSRLAELTDESQRLTKAGKAVFRESEIVQARLRVDTQKAVLDAALSRQTELKENLSRSAAIVSAAQAMRSHAQTERARRQLALQRTRIYSPVEGRIQHLFAAPGMKRMLGMDNLDSATIATLYQPDSLQARIDVPLEEAAQLAIGQPVRLRSTLLPDQVFRGRVTRIDGKADLQRNTLQAKIRLLDPADKLRPEMLCRAEFLQLNGRSTRNGSQASTTAASDRVSIYVPESALAGSGRTRQVWALDAYGKHSESREIRVGSELRDGHLRVLEGLRPGDSIVVNPPADLQAGERVTASETNQ